MICGNRAGVERQIGDRFVFGIVEKRRDGLFGRVFRQQMMHRVGVAFRRNIVFLERYPRVS